MHSRDASSTSSSDLRRAWLALGIPFVAVIAACLGLLWAFREPLAKIGAGQGAVERGALRRLEKWRTKPVERDRIVVLGDSLNICANPPSTEINNVALVVRSVSALAGRQFDMVDLTQPGLLPIHFYALLDDALETPVSLVALEVNLRTFLDPNVRAGEERLPGLARKLDFADAIRVRDALDREGMSALDPPLMRLKEQLGLLYVFEGARQAGVDLIGAVGAWATGALGVKQRSFGSFAEGSRRLALSYMVDYASHPNATVLREAVRELHEAGVPVIVYVAPVNIEYLRSRGDDFDADELERRLEALRVAIGASRTEWLDLHATVPARKFRDYQNHMIFEGCIDVGKPLAERAMRLIPKRATPPAAPGSRAPS